MEKHLPDLFETPIRTGKVRKNISYYQYRNGTININGEKFCLYSIKEAVSIWRKKHPIKIIFIIALFALTSCQKQKDNLREDDLITKKRPTSENIQASKKLTDPKVTTVSSYTPNFWHWVQAIDNPCDLETVNIDGWIGVKNRQAYNDTTYFLAWFYSINNMTATGSLSNYNYKVAYREWETSSGSKVNGSQQHIVIVRWTLTSPTGSKLTYTYKQHFVSAEDGTIIIFFTDTNYSWNCK